MRPHPHPNTLWPAGKIDRTHGNRQHTYGESNCSGKAVIQDRSPQQSIGLPDMHTFKPSLSAEFSWVLAKLVMLHLSSLSKIKAVQSAAVGATDIRKGLSDSSKVVPVTHVSCKTVSLKMTAENVSEAML